MSYIGIQSQNQISPQFSREVINGDGSATSFTLIQDVPGFNADNIMVVVNNVIQEPVAAYTIKEDANGNPRVLDFGTGNVLSTTDECYVQHRGVGTLNMTPAAGSVNAAALQDNLRSGNVDSFTATAGQTAFTLTETPLNAQSISVFVNGIYQKPTTNFTVSGTTLTLTAGAVAGDEIDVIHHTIRTTVTHVADGSVTSGKLDTNIQVAGTLGVTGNVTASADLSVAGNLTVSGTTTTIDTTVTTSDAMVINNAGTDVGLKINSTSTGNILQLQDGGVDKVVVADGGNVGIGTTSPDNPLEVVGSDSGIKITSASSTRPQLRLECGTDEKMVLSANTTYGAIGDSSDANRYMVFKDGKVGIGTTSPSGYGLSLERSGASSSEIDISLTSGTSNKECIINFGSNLANTDRYKGRIFYQTDNNVMGFWTNKTERMRIDSNGNVTMPNQPSFHIQEMNAQSAGNFIYAGATVSHNIGNHYSTSTGRFTAPVSGRYWFAAGVLSNASNARIETAVYVNTNIYAHGNESAGSSQYGGAVCSGIANLSAGDYLAFKLVNGTMYNNHQNNYFSAHLLS